MACPTPGALLESLSEDVFATMDKIDKSKFGAKDLHILDSLVSEKRNLERQHHKTALNDVSRDQGARKITSADFKVPGDWKYDSKTAG